MTTPSGREPSEPKLVDARARDQLIAEHLGLARALARRFANRGESYDDLVQAASLALVKAAERFDESRDVAFAAFATATIVGELKHHLRDRGWAVKAPRRLQELSLEVAATAGALTQRLGRSPTVREIAQECSHSEDDVLAALEVGRSYRSSSLEGLAEADEASFERYVADDSVGSTFEEHSELQAQINLLPDRDRVVLRLRFVEELSQAEIAERLGVSQMQVSRLLRHALDLLRDSYRANG
jgi:RNA polymerase sigma-B factor